jgi:hypothetical protein
MKFVACVIVFAGLLGIGVELAGATEHDGRIAYGGGINPDPPPSPPDGPNPPPPPPERTV